MKQVSRARLVASWVMLGLVGFAMIGAGGMKAFGFAPEEMVEKMGRIGLGEELRLIGVCAMAIGVLLWIPKTTSVGILLASCYWGGAMVAHMGMGDGDFVPPGMLLGLTWVGGYLRYPSLLESFGGGEAG